MIADFEKQISEFIKQECELYGDDFELDRELLGAVLEPRESKPEWKNSSSLTELDEKINQCQKCSLGSKRTNFVFGEGNPAADIVLVGEAPGAEEDRLGRPFVGAAGQLLDKILAAIQLSRNDVYICNILKCRPPQNRDPLPEEIALCQPYLMKQLEIIDPQFILCLGRFAAQTLLNTTDSLGALRGRYHQLGKARLLVTYHPAALLRDQQYKRPTWEDVQMLQKDYLEFKMSKLL